MFKDYNSNPLCYAHHLFLNGVEIKDLVIPNSVTSIGGYAFSYYTSLTSVTIPNSVTSIGGYAFSYCTSLTSVTIPNSVTSIGGYAFSYCISLTSVTIPNSVTSIGNGALKNCSGLTSITIPNSVTSIGDSAFSGCSGLTSVTIPNSVTSISDSAFSGCSGLTSVTIPNSVTTIGNLAFSGCSGLTSVTIPNGVTNIGDHAFSGCSGLTSVTISNNVTTIGDRAFSGCSGLTSVTIPNSVTSIGDAPFQDCTGLTSVTLNSNYIVSASRSYMKLKFGNQVKKYIIGESVKSIGSYAFFDCSGLTSVTIPNSVTSICYSAFCGCSRLTDVQCYAKSVPSTEDFLFYDTPIASATLHVPAASLNAYRTTEPWSGFGSIVALSSDDIEHVTYLPSNKWSGAEYTVQAISYDSGYGYGDWNESNPNYNKIVGVPEADANGKNWYDIDYSCNWEERTAPLNNWCQNFGDIYVRRAFYYDSNMPAEMYLACGHDDAPCEYYLNGELLFSETDGWFELEYYKLTEAQKALLRPGELNVLAFHVHQNWGGMYADGGLYTSLDEMGISNMCGDDLSWAFNAQTGTLTITGTGDMYNFVYSDANPQATAPWAGLRKSIRHIAFPSGITSIGTYAFQNCRSLESVTIPEGVTRIGDYAFNSCNALSELMLNEGLKEIGTRAFQNTNLKHLVIPNSVEYIGGWAFENYNNNPSLESVVLGESLSSMGYGIFMSQTNLTKITSLAVTPPTLLNEWVFANYDADLYVPAGSVAAYRTAAHWSNFGSIVAINNTPIINFADANVKALCVANWDTNGDGELSEAEAAVVTSLGNVFYNKTNITSFNELQYFTGLTSIAGYDFYYCSSLTSINIPNSVTSIGKSAFYNCKALTSINIPNSVTSIGESAFDECSNLTSATIGGSVTSIGKSAFEDCKALTSINIPNSVTSIGESAFSGCKALTSINIPNSVTSIAASTFNECNNLTSATIGSNVTSIGRDAFFNCKALTSINIPNSMTSIGNAAFYACKALTSINIPNSVNSIGDSAFQDCSSLTSVTIPNSVTSLGIYVFYGCSGLTSVTIGSNVTSIGQWAFSGCNSLTSITIPQSVKRIGERAFYGCKALTSINIPNSVTSIGSYAFYQCNSLTSINIPSSVTSLGEWVFGDCISLTTATIGCSTIGDNAFVFCEGLTSATIKKSVTSIGEAIFNQCYSLTSIIVESGNTVYDSRNNCNAIIESATNTLIAGCQSTVIPNSVTSIGEWAFYQQFRLNSIEIPDGVTSIGEDSFGGCTNLTSVIIPSSVTSIGEDAFWACSKLIDVWCYAENVPATNSTAFRSSSGNSSCVGSATLHVPTASLNAYSTTEPWSSFGTIVAIDNTPVINFADAGVKALCVDNWDTNGDGELSEEEAAAVTSLESVFEGKTNITSFNELQYFTGLTSIGNCAFDGCSGLTSITIPESVTSIGNYAFCGCTSLTSVTIPNSVTSIGVEAFDGCSSLTSIIIPNSVTSIGDWAFHGCSNLTSVAISNGVTSIGKYAFSGCSSLTSVTIPSSVTSIGYGAFSGYSSLSSIIVELGNTVYDSRNNCNAIIETATNTLIFGCQNTIIPEDVTSIGDGAFSVCSGLTSITIPESVASIGNYAFQYCSSLTDVYCYAENIPSTHSSAFDNSNISSATLHVPAASLNAYSTTVPWSSFGRIVPIDGYVINDETTSFSIEAEENGDVIFTHNFTGDWEALYLPFAIDYDAIKADFDLAEIDGVVQNDDDNDGIADFTVLSIMGFKEQMTEPNTPYLIRAKKSGEQTIVFDDVTLYPTVSASIDCSSTSIRYEFTGSYNTLNASALANRYVVQGGELVKGASSLAPCRWYMTATARKGTLNLPNRIRIMPVEDVITGVSSLEETEEGAAVYNLAGQRLNKVQKGINIVNGKKVLIK